MVDIRRFLRAARCPDQCEDDNCHAEFHRCVSDSDRVRPESIWWDDRIS
jgi:hypothetical protein